MKLQKLYSQIMQLDSMEREALFRWAANTLVADNKSDELIVWINTLLIAKTKASTEKMDFIQNAVYDALLIIPDNKLTGKIPEWRILKAVYYKYGGTKKLNKIYNNLRKSILRLRDIDLKKYNELCEDLEAREFFEKIVNKGE